VREAAACESRRRRALWAAVAVLLVAGPLALDASRQPGFHASVEIDPQRAPLFPAVYSPAYYRGLLRDPELRRQTGLHAGLGVADWDRVTVTRLPARRGLLLKTSADSPTDARRFVNALAPQLANASGRLAARRWEREARRAEARLRRRDLSPKARAFAQQFAANLKKLVATPVARIIVGRRARTPRVERLTDRVAAAFPGDVPGRPAPILAAVAGLGVAFSAWLIALGLVPPPGAAVTAASGPAPRAPSRTPAWLGAAARWFKPPAEGAAPRRAPPDRSLPRLGALAVGAVLLLAALVVLWAGRDTTLLGHEWAFAVDRRGGGAHAFLEPQDRHLVLLLVAVYKALFATAGLGDYWPYRLLAALVHAGCVAVVFTYARDRLGWLLAALLTAPILAFGPAAAVLLWAANLGVQASLVAGIAALLALERKDRTGDATACALLLVSLLTWDLGACFVLGAAVELVLQRDRRRLWIPLGPFAAYAVWYLVYSADDGVGGVFRPLAAVGYAARMAANAIDSLLALPLGGATAGHGYHTALELLGYLLLAAALALAVRRVVHIGRLTPRVAALLAILASYWLFTGATQAADGDPFAGRYVYPAAVLILLTVAELAGGARVPRRAVLTGLIAVSAVLACANAAWLADGGGDRRGDARVLRTELAAAELSGARAPAGVLVDARRAPGTTMREYLAARNDLGSPALAAADLPGAPLEGRRGADRLLRRALVAFSPADARVAAARPGARVAVGGPATPFVKLKKRCVAVNTPPGRVLVATFSLPRTGVVVIPRGKPADRRRVVVRLRRFAPAYGSPGTVLDRSGVATLVDARPDGSPRPWGVAIRAERRVSVC
jgi:hypothetical protein